MVLLPGLVSGEVVVWLLAGYCMRCGQSYIVTYDLAIVHLYIQFLMTNQYLLDE